MFASGDTPPDPDIAIPVRFGTAPDTYTGTLSNHNRTIAGGAARTSTPYARVTVSSEPTTTRAQMIEFTVDALAAASSATGVAFDGGFAGSLPPSRPPSSCQCFYTSDGLFKFDSSGTLTSPPWVAGDKIGVFVWGDQTIGHQDVAFFRNGALVGYKQASTYINPPAFLFAAAAAADSAQITLNGSIATATYAAQYQAFATALRANPSYVGEPIGDVISWHGSKVGASLSDQSDNHLPLVQNPSAPMAVTIGNTGPYADLVCADFDVNSVLRVFGGYGNFSGNPGHPKPFTFECYFRNMVQGAANLFIIGFVGSDSPGRVSCTNVQSPTVRVVTSPYGSASLTSDSNTVTNNTWTHFALSGDDTSIALFIDGVSNGPVSAAGSTIGNDNGFSIGSNGLSMAGVRVSNTRRYTANFTRPTERFDLDASTVLLSDF